LTNGDLGQYWVKVSMFVDIRELSNNSHHVMRPFSNVVRLHTLDECKRSCGDVRKNMAEAVISGHLLRDFKPQREATMFLPVSREDDTARIELDEIECQVIYGRPVRLPGLDRLICDFQDYFRLADNSSGTVG